MSHSLNDPPQPCSVSCFLLLRPHRLPSSLKHDFAAITRGLTNQLRDLTTPRKLETLGGWPAACFRFTILRVPMNSIDPSGKMLTY